jgi:hypothetical protein
MTSERKTGHMTIGFPTQFSKIACLFRTLIVVIAINALVACATSESLSVKMPERRLSLVFGAPDAIETVTQRNLAPGAIYRKIDIRTRSHGSVSGAANWALRSLPLRTQGEVDAMLGCLAKSKSDPIDYRFASASDLSASPYKIVHLGGFETQVAATNYAAESGLNECRLIPQARGYEPEWSFGPWSINVLEIDPRHFEGELSVALANGQMKGLETVSDITKRTGAFAAINASFFVMRDDDGIVGDIAGLLIDDGVVQSEATRDRFVFAVERQPKLKAAIKRIKSEIYLNWSDGSRTVLDGINRLPGKTRNCGNSGDVPFEVPWHDMTCVDANEIIFINDPSLVSEMPNGATFAHLTSDGAVKIINSRDRTSLTPLLLVGEGNGATELLEKAKLGLRATLDSSAVFTNLGVKSGTKIDVVSGGPVLLLAGKRIGLSHEEGWAITGSNVPQARAEFVHSWLNLRNPRTAVGILADGRIIFVTIDGRELGQSVGATIGELRALMQELGAIDALNLDGGGSTTMVIDGKVVNLPSDPSGPRLVGDALTLSSKR